MKSIFDWLSVIPQQYLVHKSADYDDDAYLNRYGEKLRTISIGSSFAPELIEQIYWNEKKEIVSLETKRSILRTMISELGIKEIRLGIRWNNAVNAQGKADLSYYKPFIDDCIAHNVSLCLNIGPIKTFGWPEEHIPKNFLPLLTQYTAKKNVIRPSDQIAKIAHFYVTGLLSRLKESYTKEQLARITTIQPENEPFNPFGKYKLTFSASYIRETIDTIHQAFPHTKILLNAAYVSQMPEIVSLFRSCMKDKDFAGRLICGVNYYYNVPKTLHIPFLGPIDLVTVAKMSYVNAPEELIRKVVKKGIDIEVTEAQFEQWGNSILSPGNSLHEFKYLLARCATHLVPAGVPSVIRLWGLERLAYKMYFHDLEEDHKSIIALLKRINTKDRL